jgi:hypothetical protein
VKGLYGGTVSLLSFLSCYISKNGLHGDQFELEWTAVIVCSLFAFVFSYLTHPQILAFHFFPASIMRVSLVNSLLALVRGSKHPKPFHNNADRHCVLFARSQFLKVKDRNANVTLVYLMYC